VKHAAFGHLDWLCLALNLDRATNCLETSVPVVFAAGDVWH